jgi:hypothetical protein
MDMVGVRREEMRAELRRTADNGRADGHWLVTAGARSGTDAGFSPSFFGSHPTNYCSTIAPY